MSECEIVVGKNGALKIFGEFTLKDTEGNILTPPKRPDKNWVSLCRCGDSNNKPFCDGTHKIKGFESEVAAK
ncbi:MAG: CDGSH iron-sulfur domain-containing protein [Firmicutes bacterium]|nr:CDGSH iron-sulfur domain-containing protein [Bacillota bacterium]